MHYLKNEWPTLCSFFVYLMVKKMIVAFPVLVDWCQHHNSFHLGMFDALNGHFGDDVEWDGSLPAIHHLVIYRLYSVNNELIKITIKERETKKN